MLKFILVDDHEMFRESLAKILTAENIGCVIAQASDGRQFLEQLGSHHPDIVLMDISMPDMDGIEATRKALKLFPELKILALSGFNDEKYYFSMVDAGVKGFVVKNAGINELQKAVEEVMQGGSWFSAELLRKIIIHLNTSQSQLSVQNMTQNELDVLQLICESLTDEEIAKRMNLRSDEVSHIRNSILTKTGCSNTAGLVMYAIKNKLVEI